MNRRSVTRALFLVDRITRGARAAAVVIGAVAFVSCAFEGDTWTGGPTERTSSEAVVPAGTDVGTLPGQFAVTPGGTASYSVPLWTPDGRNGMSPRLSLNYSSSAGDGPAGLGWALAGGTSVIQRCTDNSPVVRRPEPVKFDNAKDRLCLDGMPLILVAGENGRPGAQYRTEPNTFTKVLINTADGMGPTRFTAFTRDGLVHTYGGVSSAASVDLRVAGSVNDWEVTKDTRQDTDLVNFTFAASYGWLRGSTSDRSSKPNAIIYKYTQPADRNKTGGAQEPLLAQIDYVDVGGTGTRSIKLNYIDRPATALRTRFVAGMKFTSTKLLKSIDVRVAKAGTLSTVKFYELKHGFSSATGRPLLQSVRECDANPSTGTCKRPSVFSYSIGLQSFHDSGVTVPVGTDGNGTANPTQTGDVNGDGKGDVIVNPNPMEMGPDLRAFFGGDDTGDLVDLEVTAGADRSDAIIADFAGPVQGNPDGLPDLAIPGPDNVYRYFRNTGAGPHGAQFQFLGSDRANPNKAITIADFNGRGQRSILRPTFGAGWSFKFFRPNVDGGPFLSNDSDEIGGDFPSDFLEVGWSSYLVDVDFDGASDFLTSNGSSELPDYLHILSQKRPSNQNADPDPKDWKLRASPTTLLVSEFHDVVKHVFFDFNGDGLPDALRLRQGRAVPDLIINTGGGFARPTALQALYGTASNVQLGPGTVANDLLDPGIRVADIDGDGRQDIILMDDGTVRDSSSHPRRGPRSKVTALLSRGDILVPTVLSVPVGLPSDGHDKPGAATVHNWRASQLLDFNGDGLMDIFEVLGDGRGHVFIHDGPIPDLLVDVKDGMGKKTSVDYRPMTDAKVYQPAPPDSCEFPQVCVQVGYGMGSRGVLVSAYRVDNGVGGRQNAYSCTYQDGRYDVAAGVLGFTSWTWVDQTRQSSVTQTFDLTRKGKVFRDDGSGEKADVYTQIGLPTTEEALTTNGSTQRVSHVDYQYEFITTDSGLTYYTRPTFSATKNNDRGQPPLSKVLQELTYDDSLNDFGILSGMQTTYVTFNTPQGESITETTSSHFENDVDNWLLGLTTSTTLTSETRAGTGQRHINYVNDLVTGAVKRIVIEPDDETGDENLTIDLTRNASGEVTSIKRTDHFGEVRRESFTYDADSVFPATHTNAVGHVTTFDTDPGLGVVNSVKDPNNAVTGFTYDTFGRLRNVAEPGGGGLSITYARDIEPGTVTGDERFVTSTTTKINGGGEIHTITNRLGQEIRRETKNFDGSFSFLATTYNDRGLLASATRPAFVGDTATPTSFVYDQLGRLTRRVRPEDGTLKNGSNETRVAAANTTIDYNRLQATTTDDQLRISRMTSDALGRVVKSELRNNAGQFIPTEYVYGPFGVLMEVNRHNGGGGDLRTLALFYDNTGRRVFMRDPNLGERTTNYNAFGDIRSEEDAKGNVTSYTRDALGRVTDKFDLDGKTTFIWDTAANGKGRLAETTSPSGVRRQFFYDTAGRMNREISTISGKTFQVDYSFDSAGRLQKVSYPTVTGFPRFVVKNTYSANSGQLTKVQSDTTGASFWELTSAAADGQIGEEVFGNKVVTDYDYTKITGRLKTIHTVIPGTTPKPLRTLNYDYWADGNLRHRSDALAKQDERFEYDELSRLKTWTAADSGGLRMTGGWSVNYSVDDFGNITRRNFVAGSVTGGTSQDVRFTLQQGTDRVLQSTLQGSFSYDANGNQVGRPEGETVTYTAFDLPKQITGPRAETMSYDSFGTRASKRRSSTDFTLYVAGIYEQRVAGGATDDVFYVVAGGRAVAQVTRRQGGAESTVFLHGDQLGSIDAVTDSAGKVVEKTKRDPYGIKVINFNQPIIPGISAGTNKVRLGFTGHEQDDELGLVNMRGRVYDPRLGRFLTGDPLVNSPGHGQSYNRYSYVHNNPLRFVDPSGLTEETAGGDGGKDGAFDCTAAEADSMGLVRGPDGRCRVEGAGQSIVIEQPRPDPTGRNDAERNGLPETNGNNITPGGGTSGAPTGAATAATTPPPSKPAARCGAPCRTHEQMDYDQIAQANHWFPDRKHVTALSEFRHDLGDNALAAGHLAEAAANYALAEVYGVVAARGWSEIGARGPAGFGEDLIESLESWVFGDPGQPSDGTALIPGAPDGINGNSLLSTRPAQGYIMRARVDERILKYGETILGEDRYSKPFLRDVVPGGAYLQWAANGTKAEMHQWQTLKILSYMTANGGRRPELNKCNY